jgi:perosamine synthetase
MKREIPVSAPVINGNEWRYIKECLDTGWVSSVGGYVTRFEDAVARYLGTRFAIATVNGTCALHASLIGCGVGAGDEVIVPALTFVASANVVKYCGAEPVFMDCDPATLCLNAEKFARFVETRTIRKRDGFTYNKKSKRRIKAVIPVHVFGHPADMDVIVDVCARGAIDIIEDATESLGSEYKGKKAGSFGRAGCLSFNGNKIITTGGGGMVVTDDGELARKVRHLTTQARTDPVEYEHDEIGYNYRLSNIQAAMGVAQMERLDDYIRIKRAHASLYRKLLAGIDGVEFLWEEPWAKSNFWFYTIKVPARCKKPLMKYLFSKGIQVRPVWKLIHELPIYRDCEAYDIEYARDAYRTCVNLPCSVNLTREAIARVAGTIRRFFKTRRVI